MFIENGRVICQPKTLNDLDLSKLKELKLTACRITELTH